MRSYSAGEVLRLGLGERHPGRGWRLTGAQTILTATARRQGLPLSEGRRRSM